MSCPPLTNKGGKLYISDQPVDCDLTLSELAVLDYVFVPGVGSIGDTGIEQDVVAYSTTDAGLTAQGKGDAVARNWDIEIIDAPSQARDILDDASAIGNDDNYATRIEWPNGDVEFSIVQVASRTAVKGAASGVRVIRYTMVPSFIPIVTNSIPVVSNVFVTGEYVTGETLTATYDYYSPLGLPESGSVYQWYADGVAIPGADDLTYVIDVEYEGKMISFGVEPSDGLSFGPEARSAAGGPVILFTPEMLFENGLYGGGLWYPKRIINGTQMMYQDAAGTIPVTSDGDPVGLIIDSSGNGNHLIQTVSGARQTYKTDGTYEWLLPDGIDDHMVTAGDVDMKGSVASTSFFAAVPSSGDMMLELSSNSSNNPGTISMAWLDDGERVNCRHRGTTSRTLSSEPFAEAGVPSVVTLRGSIDQPLLQERGDSQQLGETVLSQGTGTMGNYPAYLFSRDGSGLFYAAPWYGSMIISTLLSPESCSRVEQYFAGMSSKTINLILVAGQSNAEGREVIANGPLWIQEGKIPNVRMFNGTGFSPYDVTKTGPSGCGSSWALSGAAGKYTWSHIALKEIAEQVANIAVCQVTTGSSPIYPEDSIRGSWNADYSSIPSGNVALLEALQNRFMAAKTYCAQNNITLNILGVLWHQGERDGALGEGAGYGQRFQAVIAKIRDFTGVPDLPIYYGTIPAASPQYNAQIRSAQLGISATDVNAWCRDNDDLTFMDGLHFDAASALLFGGEAAAEFIGGLHP